jgi:hypothetical protein
MSREKTDRFCMQCRRPMRRTDRIEMGWSVMTGRTAVCSKACLDKWNYRPALAAAQPASQEGKP